MDDIQKMLRAIINGQSAFRQEVLGKIEKLDQKIDKLGERLDRKIDGVEKRLTERIDKIGKQLAYLEDDTPTKEEFDKLEKRVTKVEHRAIS
ncbi:MAG: hypothetical protein M1426_02885 [Patescibacteria group bacterium]|nr:hypothetical protein [Patescibacteria group bacterium]